MKKAIGIDLGTTNSVVAFKDTEVRIIRSLENEELVRSCVAYINEEFLVGKSAFSVGLARSPENTIISIKRLMGGAIKDKMVQKMVKNKDYYKFGITALSGGTDEAVAVLLGGKEYTPEQISAKIINKLKEDAQEKLGDEVTHAVITVPAYFTEKQKNATRIAAQLAGLKVQQLLAEPTAAAIAYGVDNLKQGESMTVLIYDFGGGTFDLSILNIIDGQYIEAGTGGDRWLGGDDIDNTLVELIYKKVESEYNIASLKEMLGELSKKKRDGIEGAIRMEAEKAKIQLSSMKSYEIYMPNRLEDENGDIIDIEFEITREEFELDIKPYVQRTIDLIEELLKEVRYDMTVVDKILLVGGSSSIPLVKEMLSEKYGSDKIQSTERPMLIVAEGAGILSHRLGDQYEAPLDITQTVDDISYSTKHNFYIEYQTKDGGTGYRKIIECQEPLPLSKSEILKTIVNNQKIAKISIYTDIEDGEKKLEGTSFFTIDVDLPIQSEIIFNIELDKDEIFSIKAYPKGGKEFIKDIIIGRGVKDSKAYKTIEEHTVEILMNIKSWKVQEKYFELEREMIKLAESIGKDNPMDKRWAEIDFKIKNAFDEAIKDDKLEEEGRREDNIIGGAYMLVNNYNSIMVQADIQNLLSLLKEYDEVEQYNKEEIAQKIDKVTDRYIDLFALHQLKYAADEAVNKIGEDKLGETDAIKDSEYLKESHDKVLTFFQTGKRDEGYSILNEAIPVTKKYL